MSESKAEPKQNRPSNELDDYILNSLQNSREFSRNLEQKSETAINFYLVFFAALISVAAGIISADKATLLQKDIALCLGSFLLGGVGIVVCFWEYTFLSGRVIEGLYQVVLHLYFRNKDPKNYDRLGLPQLLTVLRRQKDSNHLPSLSLMSWASVYLIGFFSSIMIGLSVWSLFQLAPQINLYLPLLFGLPPEVLGGLFASIVFGLIVLYGRLVPFRSIKAYQHDLSGITKNL